MVAVLPQDTCVKDLYEHLSQLIQGNRTILMVPLNGVMDHAEKSKGGYSWIEFLRLFLLDQLSEDGLHQSHVLSLFASEDVSSHLHLSFILKQL